MIGMPMRDEDTPNTTALRAFSNNCLQMLSIIIGRVNHGCPFDTTSKHNRICAWTRHHRRIGGKDNAIC